MLSSREWSYVSDYKKKQLGIDKMVEGEFWLVKLYLAS